MTEQLVCSLATPIGRAAVATVLVWGPQTAVVIDRCFRSRYQGGELPVDRIVVGRWTGPTGGDGEQVVVARRAEAAFEIHCHGGLAAAQAIIGSLEAAGGVFVEWRASLPFQANNEIEREAIAALAQVTTATAARHLLAQFDGALEARLLEISHDIQSDDAANARQKLDELLATARVSLHLVVPFQVAICGPPNVGKSSLTNALVGYERSIVFDQPGTTRDLLTAEAAIDGWPICFVDTAGLRETDQEIEALGMERALSIASSADLVVLVFDQSQPWQLSLQPWCDRFPTALLVRNKSDLPAALGARHTEAYDTSATAGTGVPALLEGIGRRLVGRPPRVGHPLIFSQRQARLLEQTRAALHSGCGAAAERLLMSVR